MQATDEEIQALLAAINQGQDDPIRQVERLIEGYPDDARLHFLRGSLLIGTGRAIEAHASLTQAVTLAPDFALARFQLGFFELTSGEGPRALATWQPLDQQLPTDHYLAHFVAGLRALIADRFAECIAALEAGIAVNQENLPLNRDMVLIIEQCRPLLEKHDQVPAESEASATSFLLGQAGRGRLH